MREFEFALDPSETLTIRRVVTPRRIPNMGKAIYRFDSWLQPVLEENGFELVGHHKKKRWRAYFRSPGGVVAQSFVLHAAIPNDDAIDRLAEAILRYATRQRERGDAYYFDGSLGYFRARFYRHGCQNWGEGPFVDFPKLEEIRRRDRAPTLEIGLACFWNTDLFWLDGLDRPPTWDRAGYFSALRAGLSHRVYPWELESLPDALSTP